jgi:hypothetical protein
MRWAGQVVYMEDMRNVYIFIGKPEGKRLGRHRYGWEILIN